MSPPFVWVQSLNHLEFEIKYAYRFDVAGCADIYNETIDITKEEFRVGASCKELDSSMYYELNFQFWDEIDINSLKFEKRPVGKHYISVQKLNKPARWAQLWKYGTTKPEKGKIWYDKHRAYLSTLEDFEGDEIEEFPGHDYFDYLEDDEEDYGNSWINSPKGPGEFANRRKKKKSKKSKKKKGKTKLPKTDL